MRGGNFHRKRSCPAVSHICRRTMVSLSSSTTLFVRKDAPTVLVVLAGANWFLTYLWTKLCHESQSNSPNTGLTPKAGTAAVYTIHTVLPTPWDPRTTILASRDCAIVTRPSCSRDEDGCEEGEACRGRVAATRWWLSQVISRCTRPFHCLITGWFNDKVLQTDVTLEFGSGSKLSSTRSWIV